jgi:hypothetical protein
VAPDATAFGHRDARYNLILLTDWTAPRDTEVNVTWTRELWEALRPYATGGVYVNNIGQEADGDGALFRAAYGGNYPRLAAMKHTYDPTNLFRHNQNSKPAVSRSVQACCPSPAGLYSPRTGLTKAGGDYAHSSCGRR